MGGVILGNLARFSFCYGAFRETLTNPTASPYPLPSPDSDERNGNMEKYENICAAIAMMDAAHNVLDGTGDELCDDVREALHEHRNALNQRRLQLLKGAVVGRFGVDLADD